MHKITSIFDGKYFVIPKHQRGFSWSDKNVEDLFNDLDLAHMQSHYMGPLILARTDTHSFQDDQLITTAEYELEDGQQRLTALVLIMSALSKKLRSFTDEPGAEIEARELDKMLFYSTGGVRRLRLVNENEQLHGYLKRLVDGSSFTPVAYTPPMKKLDEVYDYIKHRLVDSEIEYSEVVRQKQKVTNQIKLVWVDLASEGINRYLAFDAINSRGLPLSEFDKIKNFCILVAEERGLGLAANDAWYEAITSLEKYSVGARSYEDAFVAELYSVFHSERTTQGNVHEKFVEKYRKLLKKDPDGDESVLSNFQSFVQMWAGYAESFGLITTRRRSQWYGSMCMEKAGDWLDRLDNMDLPTITRPILCAAHNQFGASEEFVQVARACEIYTFRVHAVFGTRKDANARAIVEAAHQVLRSSKGKDYILSKLCEWLAENAPMKEVIQVLGNGAPKYAYDPDVRGWQYCYYFLYEYELYHSPAGSSPIPWAAEKEKKINTQEHILPQEHRDGAFWEEEWPDETEADRYKHRLGNLVLTQGNSRLGRKPIQEKLNSNSGGYCFNSNDASNSEKRVRDYTDGNEWKVKHIVTRELDMVKFAVERWSVPCCVDNCTVDPPDSFDPQDVLGGPEIIVNYHDCIEEEQEELDEEDLE